MLDRELVRLQIENSPVELLDGLPRPDGGRGALVRLTLPIVDGAGAPERAASDRGAPQRALTD